MSKNPNNLKSECTIDADLLIWLCTCCLSRLHLKRLAQKWLSTQPSKPHLCTEMLWFLLAKSNYIYKLLCQKKKIFLLHFPSTYNCWSIWFEAAKEVYCCFLVLEILKGQAFNYGIKMKKHRWPVLITILKAVRGQSWKHLLTQIAYSHANSSSKTKGITDMRKDWSA